MADRIPLAQSPIKPPPPTAALAGWNVSARQSTAPLRLIDCTPCRKTLVRAIAAPAAALSLGVAHGHSRREVGGALIAGVAPLQWIVIDRPGAPPFTFGAQGVDGAGAGLVTVIDLTHARALVRLLGDDSAKLLAKLCAIDLGDKATPNGSALRTSVARLVVDLIRDDLPVGEGESPRRSYLISCERSAGQYLFNALMDAGAEFAIDVEGLAKP